MDVWLKNDSEKGPWFSCVVFTWSAILALKPLGEFLFLLHECLRLGFLWTESMRRGRDPSRTPSRPRRPVFDNPIVSLLNIGFEIYGFGFLSFWLPFVLLFGCFLSISVLLAAFCLLFGCLVGPAALSAGISMEIQLKE